MISSISNAMPPPPPGGGQQGASLSTDQLEGLNALLEGYDADATSAEDAAAIVEGIEELGITPGPALASAMADAGFDARAIGDQAGVGGPGQSAGGAGQTSSEALTALTTLLADQDISDMSDSDWAEIGAQMEELGYAREGALFNVRL